MNRYIIDEFHSDPHLRHRLSALARQEQSRALQAGFAWLKARVRAAFSLCIGPLRRTERLI
jgi:hypothetical protein